ncbi:DUF5410 family protein [Candidatus Tisiphia endosymbiont of Ditula angustiorana]|uniref:DUF5410 family protein n=1 Tax=Candidatus Tisiphia endosymbiont of Ditula angustiorana TaxID=3066272 RepID=UPI0039774CBC
MLQSFFIEENNPIYKNIKTFNQPIDNKLSEEIQKDLNRQLNLFIHDKNVVDSMKTQITTTPLLTSHLCKYLQDTYGLSLGQANYIVISSTQSRIGGCYPSNIISNINPNIQLLLNRQCLLSQIIIDDEENVKYIGGQVILFDIMQETASELLREGVGIENHLMIQSKDQIILYILVDLGKLGQNFTTHPKVYIQLAGKGTYGDKFLAKLNKVKIKCQECKNITYEDIIMSYQTFSEGTLYNNDKRVQRYNSLAESDIWYEVELHTDNNKNTDTGYSVLTDTKSETKLSNNKCMQSNTLLPSQEYFDNNVRSENNSNTEIEPEGRTANINYSTRNLLTFFNKLIPPTKSKKSLDNGQSNFYIDIDTNNDQVQVSSDEFNKIKQLFLIVKKIVSCTATSYDIKQLQEIFITNNYNNIIRDEFISNLDKSLGNNQLHKLNILIMQTMNELLPKEDTECLLRRSEDSIWHKLLLLEAKRCGMTIKLPDSINDELTIPEVPKEIFELYNILKDTFYNQGNRKSHKALEQRVAESIHWLFINPLIMENESFEQMDSGLQKKLLEFPGTYTELLRNFKIINITDRSFGLLMTETIDFFRNSASADDLYVDPVLESSRTFKYAAAQGEVAPPNPSAQASFERSLITQATNDIMEMFRPILIDILIKKIEKTINLQSKKMKDKNAITEVIRAYVDMKETECVLENTQLIIDDTIYFLNIIDSGDCSLILSKLLSLNTPYISNNNSSASIANQNDLVIKQDLSKQAGDNSYVIKQHSSQQYFHKIKTIYITSFCEKEDSSLADNNHYQDQGYINLLGTSWLTGEVYI